MHDKNEIILYQPDETVKLEVRMEDETVWLTQHQMADLFETSPQNITIHIRNLYNEGELDTNPTCKESLQVRMEGNRKIKRVQKYYNLDVIISVGLRLAEREENVQAKIYTQRTSPSFNVALARHNDQYAPIDLSIFTQSHDRFLLIDQDVYHIGASIKDLGKKWFAFCKMELQSDEIMEKLSQI